MALINHVGELGQETRLGGVALRCVDGSFDAAAGGVVRSTGVNTAVIVAWSVPGVTRVATSELVSGTVNHTGIVPMLCSSNASSMPREPLVDFRPFATARFWTAQMQRLGLGEVAKGGGRGGLQSGGSRR